MRCHQISSVAVCVELTEFKDNIFKRFAPLTHTLCAHITLCALTLCAHITVLALTLCAHIVVFAHSQFLKE